MHVTTYRHTPHVASHELGEFDLDYEPVMGDVDIKVVGNRAVLGYLVYDSDCENPMTSCDCMGEFITEDTRNESPWPHLGILEKPYRGDIQRDLECDGIHEEAIRTLTPDLITDQDFLDFCEENYNRTTDEDQCDMAFAEACLSQIDFKYDMDVPSWLEQKYEAACEDAWDTLYEQGRIGTFLAVPCRWHESVHGPGTAEAYPCSIEDCNAVWIPTEDDLDNIKSQVWPAGVKVEWKGALGSMHETLHAVVTFNGEVVFDTPKWADAQAYIDANYPATTHDDLYNAAVKYAEGILNEYVRWCNGDCYGIVVESYIREDEKWVKLEDAELNQCWGHIGYEYAKEELKREFDYQCKHFLKEAA